MQWESMWLQYFAVFAQVAGMICQRNAIEDLLNQERLRARDNVQQLERKLHSLQDLLVAKMREVNNARESSIPLRNEIEAFKTLIEEEERRYGKPSSSAFSHQSAGSFIQYHSIAGPGCIYLPPFTLKQPLGLLSLPHQLLWLTT